MIDWLRAQWSPVHGLGAFACRDVPVGSVVQDAPIVIVPASEAQAVQRTAVGGYTFSAGRGRVALALGTCSLMNHGDDPNATWTLHVRERFIRVVALRRIKADEEVTIDYGDERRSEL